MSENIIVTRIVDRYLEHGRIFFFSNDGNPEVYIGSSDWMERNIYRRIEVCVPLLDERLKSQIMEMLNLQLQDRVKGVVVDRDGNNVAREVDASIESSQGKLAQLVAAYD
jgi:polyphosphate kinase